MDYILKVIVVIVMVLLITRLLMGAARCPNDTAILLLSENIIAFQIYMS
ncbi:hypothetical protein CEB3_c20980 [Peptococcaceae bacterium CEB3]|nr:hypothetical protein CEB3_c20980 [Peptococcaceae bacterium CEB3]